MVICMERWILRFIVFLCGVINNDSPSRALSHAFPNSTILSQDNLLFHRAKKGKNIKMEDPNSFFLHYRGCVLEPGQLVFPVSPGIGWDILREKELGRVINLNYSYCMLTKDRKYLIPNDVEVTPIKLGFLEESSEHVSSFSSYKSTTSESMSVTVGIPVLVSVSYSEEKTKTREEQESSESEMDIISVRYRRYSITFQPGAQLHPEFSRRLREIGEELIVNSKHAPYADYLAEMLVAEFGTHYVVSYDLGGVLKETRFSSKKSKKTNETESVKKSGGVSTPFFSASASSAESSGKSEESNSSASQVFMNAFGGPVYGHTLTAHKWQSEIDNNLVVIDRRGDLLPALITWDALPDLAEEMVFQIREKVESALQRYIDVNTKGGCLDVTAANYNKNANSARPGECQKRPVNINFLGGVYMFVYPREPTLHDYRRNGFNSVYYIKNFNRRQRYKAPRLKNQPNRLTSKSSCPDGFKDTILLDKYNDIESCLVHHYFTHYVIEISGVYFQYCDVVHLVWCRPINKRNLQAGLLFGGIYNDNDANPLTGAKNCPGEYDEWPFGDGAKICLLHYDLSEEQLPDNLEFGGFYSCQYGNAMFRDRKDCPPGFKSFKAFSLHGMCDVRYCVNMKAKARKDWGPRDGLKLPPYTQVDVQALTQSVFNAAEGKLNEWVRRGGKWVLKPTNDSMKSSEEEYLLAQMKREMEK